MPRALRLLTLAACARLAPVGALNPRPSGAPQLAAGEGEGGAGNPGDEVEILGMLAESGRHWDELDVQGKTGLVLALGDGGAPGDRDAPGALYIPMIRGGIGDSLRQLGWAIFYAERHNFTTVDVQHQAFTKHLKGFLDIAADPTRRDQFGSLHSIHLEAKPVGYVPSGACTVGMTVFDVLDPRPAFRCRGFKARDWARVVTLYLKPLVVRGALVDGRAAGGELVVHMRSGDAMTTQEPASWRELQLPPCSFYDKVIERGTDGGPFQKVRIITQDDELNPCVNEVGRRHSQQNVTVTVQRGSLNEDAAALVNAEHLVLGSSFLSVFMFLMNERAKSVFYADAGQLAPSFFREFVPCGGKGGPAVYVLTVIGLSSARPTLGERQRWMSTCPNTSITIRGPC